MDIASGWFVIAVVVVEMYNDDHVVDGVVMA